MNDLVVFFLLISTVQVAPMVIITFSLLYGIPFSTISYMLGHRGPVNRRPQKIGVARFKQFLQVFDSNVMDYLTRFYVLACGIQLITVTCIVLAILYNVPLPFMPNINGLLSPGIMSDLVIFSITTSVLLLTPIVLLVMALFYGIPIPFMPSLPESRPPPSNAITRWEQQSQDFASIRLTRFENSEKTLFYAICHDDILGTVFKVVLLQEKEVRTRTECYLYTDDDPTLVKIIPTPITIDELEEIFSAEDD